MILKFNSFRWHIVLFFMLSGQVTFGQQTVFETSAGKESATYFEVINFYMDVDSASPVIKMLTMGETDSGYPLHLVLVSSDKKFDPKRWHTGNKVVIMINNGIHAGEPDGIEASMMLVRDINAGKITLPDNVVLGIIPVYNIGGTLNRGAFSRVNQDGPAHYGFRGNAQNLDLNRDFTKADSKNARSFAEIFHFLDPDVLVDTHVSDGADYQHTMTLITSQYNKMGKVSGDWVKASFEPSLYKGMKEKDWDMVPYVNVEGSDPSNGFTQFYDAPRYSSGYAALFNTISFMPETHMLKPFAQRTKATYDLLVTFIEQSSKQGNELKRTRKKAIAETVDQIDFPLEWKMDSSHFTTIPFKGYTAGTRKSAISDLFVLFYDHSKPFTKDIPFYDNYLPGKIINKPKAYLIPRGWWQVLDLLKINRVEMHPISNDTVIEVTAYQIINLKSMAGAYEKHHKNHSVQVKQVSQKIKFLKGDHIIYTNQKANRYIVEMLEPTSEDGFFAWNFFDGILQRKEYYSDYRWNSVAGDFLEKNSDLKKKFTKKMETDSAFAKSLRAQLHFIYINSPWNEPSYMRYPVYRVEK